MSLAEVEGSLGSRVGVEGLKFLSRDPLGVKEFPLVSPHEFLWDVPTEDVSPPRNLVPSFQSDDSSSIGWMLKDIFGNCYFILSCT